MQLLRKYTQNGQGVLNENALSGGAEDVREGLPPSGDPFLAAKWSDGDQEANGDTASGGGHAAPSLSVDQVERHDCCRPDFLWEDREGVMRCPEHQPPPSFGMVARVWALLKVGGELEWMDKTVVCMPIWREDRAARLAAKRQAAADAAPPDDY